MVCKDIPITNHHVSTLPTETWLNFKIFRCCHVTSIFINIIKHIGACANVTNRAHFMCSLIKFFRVIVCYCKNMEVQARAPVWGG